MFRTALRNVLAHKARLLMTVLAVMLGVAFVSGTLVFTDTIGGAFKKSSAKSYENVSVAIKPGVTGKGNSRDDERPHLTERQLDTVRALPGAASATGSVSGFTAVADKDGKLIGDGWTTRGGNFSAGKDGTDARYRMTDGRAPLKADEVALDTKTADRAQLQVGDTVRMSVDGPVMHQTVTGIFETDDGNVAAGGSLVLFDTPTAQQLFAKPGQYDEIDVKAAPGTSQAALKTAAEKALPKGTEVVTGQQLADDEAVRITAAMSGLNTGLLVFAGISLFVGIFIIANTFTMLVAQRTKELALMRAVGASRRQVTRSVLIEAFVVGLTAAVAGLVTGIGIAVGMRSLLGSTGATLPDGPLVVGSGTITASLVVGVAVTMLAAWLPARRASRIPPVAAMSSVHAPATTKSLVLRNTIGALLAGAGAALVIAGAGMSMDTGKMPLGAGAGLLLIGVFVLTPLLSRPVIAAAGPLLRPFGVTGKLARQNSVRNPRRTAATASALMIGLTLITGLTVIATSVQKGIDKLAADSVKADYTISMVNRATDLSPEVEKTLGGLGSVTASSPLRNAWIKVGGDNQSVTGVNTRTIDRLVNLDFTAGSTAGLGGTTVVVDDKSAKHSGWKVGDTLPTVYDDKAKGTLTIGGIYKGNDMLEGVLVDTATLDPHLAKIADMKVMVKTADGASAAAKDSIEKALGNNPAIKVQDKADISQDAGGMISMMLNMLYGLLAMAVIVAVLGVINTLAMSVFERSHEIGVLRAIGLDRRDVKRMVRFESLLISLFGALLGIGLGVFLGWAAGRLIAGSMDTYAMVLPWDRIAIFLGGAALVGVLAALWPARRAARLNMLSAIKAE
ncbi:FtsX-like permease family protein [Streptomyces sp. H10-C2]|uniref:ABC transporter permease n=1 Tax=unclassified Streptomyces TaxID=2593676 RepID=UPI0024BACAEA|nr:MULTISPECIES: FtsX-like permease family protein [unclassified Streptomyces]MDJ0341311.1 FtsX-like permease family protein [Streptomyces sp. PH10-H1]MDJ0370906.1 FtsX-like permease family protein [Streptomyces sp. H10-C2]